MMEEKPMREKYKGAMIIAGSDSIGGAGIQADIKTFNQIGVFAGTVVTAITCQNTAGVRNMQIIEASIIEDQIKAINEEIEISIIKTGMMYNQETIQIVANYVKETGIKLVQDPVRIATSKAKLTDANTLSAMKDLCSLSFLLTPNIPEAEMLTGLRVSSVKDIDKCAEYLLLLGAKNVLLKGGHFNESKEFIINRLYTATGDRYEFKSSRIDNREFHGTGCVLASAITAYLFQENELIEAAQKAIAFIEKKINNYLFMGLKSAIII